jgi:hypothetical protein
MADLPPTPPDPSEPSAPPPWRFAAYESWPRVPELLARAWRGERVRIPAYGRAVAVLVPPADLERLRELDRREGMGGG